jgi:cytochrome c1
VSVESITHCPQCHNEHNLFWETVDDPDWWFKCGNQDCRHQWRVEARHSTSLGNLLDLGHSLDRKRIGIE